MLAPPSRPQYLIQTGDCRTILKALPEKSVNCCVTSPPYFGLRDYGVAGQIGFEQTPDQYVAELVAVFREVHRVLRDDGTLWLNLGDSYAGSWGAQPRPNGNDKKSTLGGGGSMLSARQIRAHPKTTHTGSLKNTPGLKPKDLIGIPWRVAFALQADGWYLRQDIIWHKPNPMPESVTDRCTKAHEYIFMLSKSERYFYDHEAVREEAVCKKMPGRGMTDTRKTYGAQNGGNSGLVALRNRLNDQGEPDQTRNRRSVWNVATQAYKGAHFATFPPALIEPCILAGCPINGIVLDPFGGAGTTGLVATQNGRRALLIELNPDYAAMAAKRIAETATHSPARSHR
jgi:DNA modification methylase